MEKDTAKTDTPRFILGIFFVSLVLRYVYLIQIKGNPFFVPPLHSLDPYIYNVWAQEIAGGNLVGSKIFSGMPLYAYFLGLIYAFFDNSVYMAKAVQMVLGSLSVCLVYAIAKKAFNRAVGVIASFLALGYSMFMFYEGFLVSTSLEVFLYSLILLFLLSAKDSPGIFRWYGIGVVVGVSALARAGILLFVPSIVIWILVIYRDKITIDKYIYIFCFLLAIAMMIAPVIVRNNVVGKDMVFITAHGGINFYIGNNPESDGTFRPPKHMVSRAQGLLKDAALLAERAKGRALRPSEVSKYWYLKSLDFIQEEPFAYLRLLRRKAVLFFNGFEISDVMNHEFFKRFSPMLKWPWISFRIICPLAMLGMFLSLKERKKVGILHLFVISYAGSVILFFVNSRYRMPLVPIFIVFAAYSIFWIFQHIRKKTWLSSTFAVSSLVCLSFVTNRNVITQDQSISYNNLALFYKSKGLYQEAITEFRHALRINASHAEVYYNLGNLHYERKKYKAAIKMFEKALGINPHIAIFHRRLGFAYANEGRLEEAKYEWEKAYEIDPGQDDLRLNLERIKKMGY